MMDDITASDEPNASRIELWSNQTPSVPQKNDMGLEEKKWTAETNTANAQ